jgi:hypothetical protein
VAAAPIGMTVFLHQRCCLGRSWVCAPAPRRARSGTCATMGVVDDVSRVMVLADDEARLLAHVLAVFERVLRLGALDHQQLQLLVPDGVMAGVERADVEMAEVVAEAGDPLRRQLM